MAHRQYFTNTCFKGLNVSHILQPQKARFRAGGDLSEATFCVNYEPVSTSFTLPDTLDLPNRSLKFCKNIPSPLPPHTDSSSRLLTSKIVKEDLFQNENHLWVSVPVATQVAND